MNENRERSHVSIEIDQDEDLAAYMVSKTQPTRRPHICSIFRVPKELRILNEDRYEPFSVSIGPYHYGKENLNVSEEQKKVYLHALLSRSTPTNASLMKEIVKAVSNLEADARGCYADEPIRFTRDEFVRLMVLDGCFIIELFYRYARYYGIKSMEEHMSMDMVTNDDPIFQIASMESSLRRDLVLLENQLPFIVLKCLFDLTKDPNQECSLYDLITGYFTPILPHQFLGGDNIEVNHMLDLLRSFLCPLHEKIESPYAYTFIPYIPCATDLESHGIRFKLLGRYEKGMFGIKFKYGVLYIPRLRFDTSTTILLPNMIALEQCRPEYRDQVTSYAMFLSCLIKSKADVKLLFQHSIMARSFQDDRKIAAEICNLCEGVTIRRFYFQSLGLELQRYCFRPWNQWRALLQKEYISRLPPWAVFSVAGAIMALILTFIQTYYAVISYSKPKNSH